MTNNQRKWSAGTASDRLEGSFSRIARGSPGTAHVFTEVFATEARDQAANIADTSPLSGALVSVKDLLNVKGFATRAGSPALMSRQQASVDAPCIARLRDAGAVFVGHTNMTELAYSGIGMNPYFGTPDNPLYPGCVPGGSSSGGGVSVALGLCDIAIGSDTGGSIRIPAAFNGLVGFKPTQNTVSREGGVALSTTLDSFGPIAASVADCADCWRVMAGVEEPRPNGSRQDDRVLVVPVNFGRDKLDKAVEAGFAGAMAKLAEGGFRVVEEHLPSLDFYNGIPAWQIAGYEALQIHKKVIETHGSVMDPRVLGRILRAETVTREDYEATLRARAEFINRFADDLDGRFLLLPTVAVLPPTLKSLATDPDFVRANALVLRNTSMGNFADGCSISLPWKFADHTIGVMLTGAGGRDEVLLALAAQIEPLLAG